MCQFTLVPHQRANNTAILQHQIYFAPGYSICWSFDTSGTQKIKYAID